jgi:hypothetical protein
MSTGGAISIRPEVLRQAGAELNQVGDRLRGLLDSLEQEVLTGVGEPWGNDNIGQLIGQAYKEVVHWAFDILRGLLNELLQSGADLRRMAEIYERLENDLVDGFRRFIDSLDIR